MSPKILQKLATAKRDDSIINRQKWNVHFRILLNRTTSRQISNKTSVLTSQRYRFQRDQTRVPSPILNPVPSLALPLTTSLTMQLSFSITIITIIAVGSTGTNALPSNIVFGSADNKTLPDIPFVSPPPPAPQLQPGQKMLSTHPTVCIKSNSKDFHSTGQYCYDQEIDPDYCMVVPYNAWITETRFTGSTTCTVYDNVDCSESAHWSIYSDSAQSIRFGSRSYACRRPN